MFEIDEENPLKDEIVISLDGDEQDEHSKDLPETEDVRATEGDKELEPDDDRLSEIDALRAERAALQEEKERLAREKDEAINAAVQAKKDVLSGAINQFRSEYDREFSGKTQLQQKLEKARVDQDGDLVAELTGQIAEKDRRLLAIQEDYLNVRDQLVSLNSSNNPKAEDKPEDKKIEMLRDWLADNSWYNDPEHAEKRKYFLKLAKDLESQGYDPAKIKFWTHIDKKLADFGTKKDRRTPPPSRPNFNNNPGVSDRMVNQQKLDKIISEQTDKIMRVMEKTGRGLSQDQYESRRKLVELSVRRQLTDAAQKRA